MTKVLLELVPRILCPILHKYRDPNDCVECDCYDGALINPTTILCKSDEMEVE
jgi:hypothetical protein